MSSVMAYWRISKRLLSEMQQHRKSDIPRRLSERRSCVTAMTVAWPISMVLLDLAHRRLRTDIFEKIFGIEIVLSGGNGRLAFLQQVAEPGAMA